MTPLYKTLNSKSMPLDPEVLSRLCLYLEENHAPVQRPRFLGSGSFGYAFKINNEKAVKLTSDDKEAWVADYLREKNLPKTSPLVRVFDVAEIYNVDGEPIYAIVEEFLKPASKKWRNFARDFLAQDEKKRSDEDDDYWFYGENTLKTLPEYGYSREEEKWAKKFIKTLNKFGIKYNDLHEKNILMRNGFPVAIDINNGVPERKIKQI